MTFRDVSSVHEIECDLFVDPWPRRSFEEEIKTENISFPFIIEENNEIIGYIICWYYFNEIHIGNIAVRRLFQGRGLGKYMLNMVFEYFKEYEKAFLEVRETNKPAQQLYKSFGFQTTYRRISYYPNGEDALIMIKIAK
jgi:ribosomal-protein-alanine N-acetyltransferase